MKKINLTATAAFGLEAVVKREAQSLGFEDINVTDGRINFKGDFSSLIRANLKLKALKSFSKALKKLIGRKFCLWMQIL